MKKIFFWLLQARSSWLFSLLRIIQTNHPQCDLFLACFIQIVSWSGTILYSIHTTLIVQLLFPTDLFLGILLVYADGSICLDILQNQWSPIYDVAAILTSIQVWWRIIGGYCDLFVVWDLQCVQAHVLHALSNLAFSRFAHWRCT